MAKKNNNSLAVLDGYKEKDFNVLVPVQTMQDFPDIYRMAINTVKIDLAQDTYVMDKEYDKVKKDWVPKTYALNKVGLEKLMTAANIQIVESKMVIPSTTMAAAEMARQLGQLVQYDKRDVAWQVVLSVPDITGSNRLVKATKEIIADEVLEECREQQKNKKIWKNKQKVDASEEEKEAAAQVNFKQIMKHRIALAESKAVNRALRKALMIQNKYTAKELAKPFAVPIVVPNMDNPDMKQACIDRYKLSSNILFGQAEEVSTSNMIEVPAETNSLPEPETADIIEGEPEQEADVFANICEECGKEIKDFTANNQTMTVEEIKEYSKKAYGKELCAACISKRRKVKKNG